jgi:methylmalonyl-CoA/ethylmalonyl-CoA epimerase
LRQVAQRADDLERAEAFYRDVLGLPLLARFEGAGLVFFDLGGVRLLLQRDMPSAVLYLVTDDLDGRIKELEGRGVDVVHGPHLAYSDDTGVFGAPGTQMRIASILDSEENLVCFSEER